MNAAATTGTVQSRYMSRNANETKMWKCSSSIPPVMWMRIADHAMKAIATR